MTARNLLLIGCIWFAAALVLGIWLARTDFAVGWVDRGLASRTVAITAACGLAIACLLFLTGWILPLGLGACRLLRKG